MHLKYFCKTIFIVLSRMIGNSLRNWFPKRGSNHRSYGSDQRTSPNHFGAAWFQKIVWFWFFTNLFIYTFEWAKVGVLRTVSRFAEAEDKLRRAIVAESGCEFLCSNIKQRREWFSDCVCLMIIKRTVWSNRRNTVVSVSCSTYTLFFKSTIISLLFRSFIEAIFSISLLKNVLLYKKLLKSFFTYIYMYMVFTAEGFFEVAIESWPE